MEISDKIIVINRGEVEQIGSAREVNGVSVTAFDFTKNEWEINQEVFIKFKAFKAFESVDGHEVIRKQLEQLGYIE